MSKPLTPKQIEILKEIRHFYRMHGFMPTVRELAKIKGLSVSTVHQYLESLEKKGWISLGGSARGIALTEDREQTGLHVKLPISGTITDSTVKWLPHDEAKQLTLPFDPGSKRVCGVQIQDDSLISSGINKGDFLIINTLQNPESDPSNWPNIKGIGSKIVALLRLF